MAVPKMEPEHPSNGLQWNTGRSVADKLSAAGWSWVIAAPLQSRVGDGGLLMRTEATANATLSNLMSSWARF